MRTKRWGDNVASGRGNGLNDGDFPWLHDRVGHAVELQGEMGNNSNQAETAAGCRKEFFVCVIYHPGLAIRVNVFNTVYEVAQSLMPTPGTVAVGPMSEKRGVGLSCGSIPDRRITSAKSYFDHNHVQGKSDHFAPNTPLSELLIGSSATDTN
jgi:hypothetical protein